MTRADHLDDEELCDAAADLALESAAAEHLLQCSECRARVDTARQTLSAGRAELTARVDRAVANFRMPALPERAARRSPFWAFVAAPVPAYAAAALILAVLLPTILNMTRPGPELGGVKAVSLGLSAEDLFERAYAVDLRDPLAVRATVDLLENHLKKHPDDLSIHVKLIELYSALLRLQGWEDATHTVQGVRERLAGERRLVGDKLPALLSAGERP